MVAVAVFGLLAGVGQGAVYSYNAGGTPDPIPDGGFNDGAYAPTDVVTKQFTLSGQSYNIGDIWITLDISGYNGTTGYTGDLVATLAKDGVATAVLLNRAGGDSGYDGFSITLTSLKNPATGSAYDDIHNYQDISPAPIVENRVVGTWSADGRGGADLGTGTSLVRGYTLDEFKGVDPNGTWTLMIGDNSTGFGMQLNSFSVDITAVPEPAATAAAVAGLLAAFALLRRPQFRARLGGLLSR